ncbi:protein arginine methyltransferase NDUFAF7, mitochondrial-like [Lineus longissimus]|uniref:protein arginine methyltransferase NDUFAF7, mitochondrial-like n=1 Tax=Lineus longissimus TaxID=88925 RepID=UPI00315CB9AE
MINQLGSRIVASCGGRTVINHVRRCCAQKREDSSLLRQLQAKIKISGPITVADYMKEVLTNPAAGYYMHQDVFGSQGDFITSPEISQIFGELIGVWCVNEWMQIGSPSKFQLVELGPGRGTLTDDILRVFSKFPLKDAVSAHLVEVSPTLSDMQKVKLQGGETGGESEQTTSSFSYKHCLSKHGCRVSWYQQLQDVPRGPSVFIAHEFFDALPVHKFQKTDQRWNEILVDLDPNSDGLRYVLSKRQTLAAKTLLKVKRDDPRDHIEVCPEAGILMQELSTRIAEDGGFALLADYGHSGEKGDTFRAFREHKLHDPLNEPGSADLTADVDFSYLKEMAGQKVSSYGPITQDQFLYHMGIGARLQVLLGSATPSQRKDLISGYDMLTNHSKMGERFKFMALMQNDRKDYIPAGFENHS